MRLALQLFHWHRWIYVSAGHGFTSYRCTRCPATKTKESV